jgi:hypothetical protein
MSSRDLCIDCKFYIKFIYSDSQSIAHYCSKDVEVEDIDPVTGYIDKYKLSDCNNNRKIGGRCGTKGVYWTKKK